MSSGNGLRWTTTLEGRIDLRPIVSTDAIYVRSGGDVVALEQSTGTAAWSTRIDPDNGARGFFALSDQTLITSRIDGDETVFCAVSLQGSPVWEVPTGVLVLDGVMVSGGQLLAVGALHGASQFLCIEASTGTVVSQFPIPWRPDRLAVIGDQLFGSKRTEPGLVRLDEGGLAADQYCPDPVFGMTLGDTPGVISVMVDDCSFLRRLSETLQVEWEQPASTTHFASDSTALVCSGRNDAAVAELLDIGTGASLWTSETLTDSPVSFALLDRLVEARGLTSLVVLDRRDGSVVGEHLLGSSMVDSGTGGYLLTTMRDIHHYEYPEA